MNKDKYWLAFASIEEIGSAFIKKLYENFGCIKSAWCAGPDNLYKIEELTKKQIDYFLKARERISPEKCQEYIQSKGIQYINYDDENYPGLLKQIFNPPMTLFYKGDFKRCNLDRTLAVVGSRKASQNAQNTLSKIISEFQGTDICIVSGLATGIDTCAHKSAIKNNLSTIGVIGSGFDYIYPKANKSLFKEIEENAGVVISEYWPQEQPMPWRFPHRNRIVSGLCAGTLVAEAAIKSGALITARLCLEQNRELMCLPGLISNPNTEGIYKLLKEGAALVTCAQDILDTLDWTITTTPAVENEKLKNLSPSEYKIIDLIRKEDCTADRISADLNMDFSELMVVLTTLELNGYIKQIDGDKYSAII